MYLSTARNHAPVPSHPVAPPSREEYNRQRKAWKAHCKAVRTQRKAASKAKA